VFQRDEARQFVLIKIGAHGRALPKPSADHPSISAMRRLIA
jgi:hypothetical protein